MTTSVASSSSQYCSRSLPETSARLPAETKVRSPSPRPATLRRMAIPNAPDWEKKPTRPGVGISGETAALSEIAGSVLMTPSPFGPTRRIPLPRARSSRRRCRSAPSGPASAKPEEMTTSPCTPRRAQSWTASCTASALTAMIARSTPPGMAAMLR